MAEQLYNSLNRHGLGTIDGCTNNIPIVIQSFFQEALVKFATLSDLPLVLLMRFNADTVWDWETIGTIAHGVGPASDYLFKWTPPSGFVSTNS